MTSRMVDLPKIRKLSTKQLLNLEIGQAYGCRLGHLSTVGQLFMVLQHPPITDSIDKEIKAWTQSYLADSIEHLKFKEDGPHCRLVVEVNRASNTVARGVLFSLDTETGQAAVDFVDLGELKLVPVGNLFEATPAVKATKWKGIACVLDGMNMFQGTDLLLEAFNAFSDTLKSPNLQLTVHGKFNSNYIIQLDNMSPAIVNVNEKIFGHIDNASKLDISDGFIGSITNIDEDGQINIITPPGEPVDTFGHLNRFLARFEASELRSIFPGSTQENVDMGKVYLAKSGKDGKLFRARVQDLNPLTARVQFIDYGDVTDIEYSDLFLAQHLDSTAARLRPLGKKAYMKWVRKVTDLERAREFLLAKNWKFQQRKEFRNYEPVFCVHDPLTGDIVNQVLVMENMATKG